MDVPCCPNCGCNQGIGDVCPECGHVESIECDCEYCTDLTGKALDTPGEG